MKRILTFLIFIIFLNSGLVCSFGAEPTFTDIKGHWAEKHIENLLSKGIISVDKSGKFRPDEVIKGYEFTIMAVNSVLPYECYMDNSYTSSTVSISNILSKLNVKKDDFYYNAYEKSLLYQSSLFEMHNYYPIKYIYPEDTLLRGEIFVMLSHLLPYKLVYTDTPFYMVSCEYHGVDSELKSYNNFGLRAANYKDCSDLFYTEYEFPFLTEMVSLGSSLIKLGIIRDEEAGLLEEHKYLFPEKPCTRAEAAAMLSRMPDFMEIRSLELENEKNPKKDKTPFEFEFVRAHFEPSDGHDYSALIVLKCNKKAYINVNGMSNQNELWGYIKTPAIKEYMSMGTVGQSIAAECYTDTMRRMDNPLVTFKRYGNPDEGEEPILLPGYWAVFRCYYDSPGTKELSVKVIDLAGNSKSTKLIIEIP